MVANATRQIETAKRAVLPRADARAGEEKFATVSFWSDSDDSITVSSLSTHELHGFYDQEQPEVASVDQSNQQYSILALTDSSGNVSERYAYTAYGQPTFLNASATVQTSSAANNRYTYTAREWDATLSLHHFRARWMSGLTGRFLSRDSIGYEDGRSLYRAYFVQSKLDPSGEACLVYFDCYLSGTERVSWKTTRCNYTCVIDITRGGKNSDPPGTKDVPGVGAVDCKDPRIATMQHVMSYNTHVCSCVNFWETQTAYDDWINPVRDCSRSECKAKIATQVARLRQTCKLFGAGPQKIACEALARAIEAGADEVCDLCDKP